MGGGICALQHIDCRTGQAFGKSGVAAVERMAATLRFVIYPPKLPGRGLILRISDNYIIRARHECPPQGKGFHGGRCGEKCAANVRPLGKFLRRFYSSSGKSFDNSSGETLSKDSSSADPFCGFAAGCADLMM